MAHTRRTLPNVDWDSVTEDRRRDRDVAMYGLVDALTRYSAAGADESRSYVALGESVWWIVCLDVWHEGDDLNKRAHYRAARAAHTTGRYVAGLRAARNWVAHGLCPLLNLDRSGFQFPISFPLGFFELRWKTADELPPSAQADTGDPANIFRKYLAGQPARFALQRARQFFAFDVHEIAGQ
jgi:hypothetical protein